MRGLAATVLSMYVIAAQGSLYFQFEQSAWREGIQDWLYVVLGTVWVLIFVLATRATFKGVMLADWENWGS